MGGVDDNINCESKYLDGIIKYRRFLYLGQEIGLYQPQDCTKEITFEKEQLSCLEQLIADNKLTDVVDHIIKAHKDGPARSFNEAIIFALALATKQELMTVKQQSYLAVRTVLESPEDLFLFIKFSEMLSKPHTGWGRGLRKAVSVWYLNQEPLTLARKVTSVKNRYGWSHRDVLKLAHPKAKDSARACVLSYVMKGLSEAQSKYGETPEALPVLAFLQAVNDVRHGQDEQQVARMIESHQLGMEYVPTQLLKSREIWSVLVLSMPLQCLLRNLKRLAYIGHLKASSPLIPTLMDSLKNQTAISNSDLHPAQVYLIMLEYEIMGRPQPKIITKTPAVGTDGAPPRQPIKKKQKPPTRPNPKVLEALGQLFVASFKLIEPTGLRYLIAVDVRNPMVHGKCFRSPNLTPAQASTLITLTLLATEEQVTVTAFSQPDMIKVDLPKDVTMVEAAKKFRETPMGVFDLTKPLTWAQAHKQPVDVFIMLTDNQVKLTAAPLATYLNQYRQSLQIPTAKVVVCALSLSKFLISSDDPGILHVAGFNEKVPRVIDAFARGAF